MASFYVSYPGNGGGGVPIYPTFAAFPATAPDGTVAIAEDTDILYAYNASSMSWVIIGGPGSVLSIGPIDSNGASVDGATIAADKLIMQSASVTDPGLVNNTTQSFSGNKTFTGTIGASNLSGTNTGDVTLTPVGAVPNADGASLSGQVLTLEPADATHPGVLTAADWNTFNNKQNALTFTDSIQNTAGTVTLVGDTATPAASQYYGTNAGSTLGYYNLPASSGTVTTVSVVTANGLAGTVANATTTPAITLSTTVTGILQGNGTAISAATTGNLTSTPTTNLVVTGGTGAVLGTGALLTLTGASIVEATSSVLTITGAANAVLGTGVSIQVKQSSTSQDGYLSSTDWNTFNNKLTSTLPSGDIFVGNVSNVATAVAMSGDATLANTGALTLATVNTNVGSFTNANITVNAKGLITAASNGSSGGGTAYNVVSKTSAYTAVANDYVLVDATSVGFSIILPTAIGISGQSIVVERIDMTLANIVTVVTTLGQNIQGTGARHLYTQWESWIFVSDGANWFVPHHFSNTPWVSATIVFGASGSVPTLTTGVTTNNFQWKRVDGNNMHMRWNLKTVNGGGSNGSGTYVFQVPSGTTIDTSIITIGDIAVNYDAGTVVGTGIGGNSAVVNNGTIWWIPYSANGVYGVVNTGNTLSSGYIGLNNASGTVAISLDAIVPITNWEQ